MLTPTSILGPHGRIAQRLKRYRFRPQQLAMADAVSAALAESRHLVVEAGTGVGKSFAYLVPAILAVTDPDEPLQRIIVSTHTISLQEQLLSKDLPLLNAVIPREFTAVLGKGRGNYLSRRRLERAEERAASLFGSDDDTDQLLAIRKWLPDTLDGSLSDLTFEPSAAVWREVESDSSNCLRQKCQHHKRCFYYQARQRLQHAQIIVVNHALFFTDLVLRSNQGHGVLPPYSAVIFDEAHTIESVAAEYFGLHAGSGQISYQLNRLYNPQSGRGQLAVKHLAKLQRQVTQCYDRAADWFSSLGEKLAQMQTGAAPRGRSSPLRIEQPIFDAAGVTDPLSGLVRRLKGAAKQATTDEEQQELQSAAERLAVIADAIDAWAKQRDSSLVYWVESLPSRRDTPRIQLAAAPVDVAGSLRESLFQEVPRVVMASATLTTGKEGGFEFFQQRVGLSGARTIQVGSPFDYERQAKLVMVQGLPDPSQQRDAFEQACLKLLPHYIGRTAGRAFCLFTSYALLRRAEAELEPWAAKQGLTLFTQGGGTPRHQLLDQFKRHPSAVLLGTASFWQGVDVPGDALQNVIITKLPFSVPDHPLIEAKLEAIRARHGNPFIEYLVPEAVIRLKQGFGRLIRSNEDHGMVVILDPRVLTKPYGRLFLAALPECPRFVDQCSPDGRLLNPSSEEC